MTTTIDETRHELRIDKSVPMPIRRSSSNMLKVFKQMEIGDSVFVPDLRDSFRGNCYWRAAYAGIKVSIRRVKESDVEGVRIWRVE